MSSLQKSTKQPIEGVKWQVNKIIIQNQKSFLFAPGILSTSLKHYGKPLDIMPG